MRVFSMNESELTKRVRLQYASMGCLLWRNNVGACEDKTGRIIRYGLANESSQMNAQIKSSDLIGISPVIITYDMVGMKLGQFMAIECKRPGWKWSGTEREIAQNRFHDLVRAHGGYAGFVTG